MKKQRALTLVSMVFLILILAALSPSAYAEEKSSMLGLPEVHWKIQSLYPPPVEVFSGNLSTYGQGYTLFERVAKKTNGKLDIKLYIPGALFKRTEVLQACKTGAIDGVLAGGAYYGGTIPVGPLENNPLFVAKNHKSFYPVIFESKWYEILRKAYAKHGIYYFSPLNSASVSFMTDFPIHSGADFKGKIIPCSGAAAKFVGHYGGRGVSYNPADLYPGLQRGTFNGCFYPLYTGVTYKLFEVTKYIMLPPAALGNGNLIFNLDSWNKLPKVYQAILTETAMEIVKDKYLKSADELDEWAVENASKQGIKIVFLSDEVLKEFRATARGVFEAYAKEKKDESCFELINMYNKYFK